MHGKSKREKTALARYVTRRICFLLGILLSVGEVSAADTTSPALDSETILDAFVAVREAMEKSDMEALTRLVYFHSRSDYERLMQRLHKEYEKSQEEVFLEMWAGPLRDRLKLYGPVKLDEDIYVSLLLEDRGRTSWIAYELIAKEVNRGEIKIVIPEYFQAVNRDEVGKIGLQSKKDREKQYVRDMLKMNNSALGKRTREFEALLELYNSMITDTTGGPRIVIPQLCVPPGILKKMANASDKEQRDLLEEYIK